MLLQRLRHLSMQFQVYRHLPESISEHCSVHLRFRHGVPAVLEDIGEQLEATGVLNEAIECDQWCETLNHMS